ncbi:MAG: hypothetical protein IH840_17765 [Candidatus Heimdallarchaeota archaeon]|nr:hypothetical protein [Candidatus Heimdallarchaeota archaeon]
MNELLKEFKKDHKVTPFAKLIKSANKPHQFKWSIGFDTKSSYQLRDIWASWYQMTGPRTNIKIIPDRLTKLTPNILLHWFTGDGSRERKFVQFVHIWIQSVRK